MSANLSEYIIALWKNKKWSQGGKMPYMSGTFTLPRDMKKGEQVRVALWANEKPKSEKSPQWSGKEDTYKKEESAPAPSYQNDAPW